jgi:DNA-binding transcriptional LysR family regulator
MTLNQLRIFEAVARYRNVTKAALDLHLSQSALSQQLRLLEQQYRTRLYSRSSQGVELTREGRSFLDAIRPILAQIEGVESRFRIEVDAREDHVLKVGGTHSICVTVLPEILMVFKQTHPWVQFTLETNNSRTIEQRILSSELEIALISDPSSSPELTLEPYKKLEVTAFALSTSPLRGRKLSLAELAQVPLVVKSIKRESQVITELLKHGYKPTIAVQCEASEAVRAAVEEGMGIGILYGDSVKDGIESGTLIKIDVPDLKRIEPECFIAYDKRKPLSAIAQDFLETLRARKVAVAQGEQKRRDFHKPASAGTSRIKIAG